MTPKKQSLSEKLAKGVVLVAEGYLFELERRGYLKAGPFVPEAVLKFPDALKELHLEFSRTGSDVIVAFTYYGHRSKMKSVGLEDQLESLNLKAVELAKNVADANKCFTAGNICNTWEYDISRVKASEKKVKAIFTEQVQWAISGGVDFIIAETFSHLGEALIALEVIKKAGLPAVVTFTPASPKSCDGYTWAEACKILEENGADVVGLNCGCGPQTMLPILTEIRQNVSGHVAALPVPFRTDHQSRSFFDLRLPDGKNAFPVSLDPFLLTRFEMAEFTLRARDMGINYIGICCGAGPHHVRSMAEALGRNVPASKYSPDPNLHPLVGDENSQKRQYRECLLGPMPDDQNSNK
ncbi:MAG: homocysteine S-methyltransferase family protein [Desulfobacterales bacterium]|jgi:betaine-homocysteine S-methyltransferase